MRTSLLLVTALFLALSASLPAQNSRYMVEISPSGGNTPLIVQAGVEVQFRATVYEFTPSGKSVVTPATLQWSVEPSAFGTITQDGRFVAAGQAVSTSARVVAVAGINGISLHAATAVALANAHNGPYTFTGVVRDVTGLGIKHATVQLMSASALPFNMTGKTNEQGVFNIQAPTGIYILRAEAAGYIPQYFDHVATADVATRISTDPARLVYDHLDFDLGSGARIEGTVTDAATGAPLAGISLVAELAGTTRPPNSAAWSAKSDEHGRYTIAGLPEGSWIVSASGKDFITEFYNNVLDRSAADVLVLAAGAVRTGVDFALEKKAQDPTYVIRGTVRDANGVALPGSAVMAEMAGGPMLHWLTTRNREDGSYEFIVPAGEWIVWAVRAGYVTEYYDNAPDAASATRVRVDATAPVATNIDFSLGEGGSITGVVLEAGSSTPIAHAAVWVIPQSSGGSPNSAGMQAVSDAQGVYRITGLVTGNYLVSARAEGYAQQFYNGVADQALATQVAVVDGQSTGGIDFALAALPGISGTVTDESNGQPLAKAVVFIENAAMRLVATTNEQGRYRLAVAPGSYKVRAERQGYAAEWYNNKADAALADDVVLTPGGSVTGIDFSLLRHGGSIAGVVRDAGGAAIAGARVSAWLPSPASNVHPAGVGKATSAADGSYRIEGLAAGNYLVRAEAKGALPEYYDNAATPQLASPVAVATNQAVVGIDFALDGGGSIAGSVTDVATGLPIAHAMVRVRSGQIRGEWGARSDAQGNYLVEGLPSGDYTVYFVAPRYIAEYYDDAVLPASATPVAVVAPQRVNGINAALASGPVGPRNYRGSVKAATGPVPAFTLVEAIDPSTRQVVVGTTDERGEFSIDAMDNAILRARAIGFVGLYAGNTHDWSRSSNSGFVAETPEFILEQLPEAGFADIQGRVLDARSGAAVAEAWVYGLDAEGGRYFSTTNNDGQYFIPNTSNGDLTLIVSEAGFALTEQSVSVNEGRGTATITVQPTGVTSQESITAPVSMMLRQNFPNPFNPATSIGFQIPREGPVALRIFNLLGKEITTLVNEHMKPGSYSVNWHADGLPSGIYLYRLEAGGKSITRRMTLTR